MRGKKTLLTFLCSLICTLYSDTVKIDILQVLQVLKQDNFVGLSRLIIFSCIQCSL